MPASAWKCAGHTLDLSSPLVMGILNVTPDSFSDGGTHDSFEAAVAHGLAMAAEGAAIIDVGGESTRPNAAPVSAAEEIRRVVPVVRELAGRGLVVSVDTSRPEVMLAAAGAGAAILNDVRGFELPGAFEAAAGTDLGLCIMHMRGTPSTMDTMTDYADVAADVAAYLLARARAFEAAGVERSRICLDPGYGFAKTHEQNYELLAGQATVAGLGYPVLAGLSRKRCVGRAAGIEDPAARDTASVVAAVLAAQQGAGILRVHNVRATAEGLAVLGEFNKGRKKK